MNPEHDRFLASDEWQQMLEQVVLPFTLDDGGYAALGDDVLELGPGPGLTTTAMPFESGRFTGAVSLTLHHVPTAERQDQLLHEVRRVLRPGALFVASDSLASEHLAAFHAGDVYNPVEPEGLPDRLTAAGFTDVEVRTNPIVWAGHARA